MVTLGRCVLLGSTDGNFSRSRSSSISSLDNISSEAIQCLQFSDSFAKRGEYTLQPTLWVGTSLGSVLVISLNFPPSNEVRHTQPVLVAPSGKQHRSFAAPRGQSLRRVCQKGMSPGEGLRYLVVCRPKERDVIVPFTPGQSTIFRMKGSILCIRFLDSNGSPFPSPSASSVPKPPPAPAGGQHETQYTVIVSDRQVRVVALPSHACIYKAQSKCPPLVSWLSDIPPLFPGCPCLVLFVATGHILILSLPSLRNLINVEFLPLTDLRIARTFCLGTFGLGLYLASPSEIQRFSVSSLYCQNLIEMLPEVHVTQDTPEPPKESFLKGLFSGGMRSIDRDELFGEASGKPTRGVAKHVASAAIDAIHAKASTTNSEFTKARQAILERGEKLKGVDDVTAKMAMEAQEYQKNAHDLMLRYKDKKWYQL
ncbi:unnamed protein product [Cyprideis torosa]|uniref:Uncharacterized protein n=1 Tax=Cyprideis torosa TaxID=163714 RepID=A0A7R8ZNP2_9CRUS|nr:unnamed protein product [Cyprideis torosa]CAG0886794.1 unnamed protein product [Cyprideis torosa]